MPQDSGMKTTRQRQEEAEARSRKAFSEAVERLKKRPQKRGSRPIDVRPPKRGLPRRSSPRY